MRIIARYIDNSLDKELTIEFRGFDWFGAWYANSYDTVKVLEVIQEY